MTGTRAFFLFAFTLVVAAPLAPSQDPYASDRLRMVADQIAARGVRDARVLDAMRSVPRHLFVPPPARGRAYDDGPLPIGYGQTISQPFIVALMTELARPSPADRALEIGTGSGYQAAVLSRLVAHVYSVEIVGALAREAALRLKAGGYANVTVRNGDGYQGWPERGPFEIVMVTAAPEQIPPALVRQLAPGGRMIVPVGPAYDIQQLTVVEKDQRGLTTARTVTPVSFVPMVR